MYAIHGIFCVDFQNEVYVQIDSNDSRLLYYAIQYVWCWYIVVCLLLQSNVVDVKQQSSRIRHLVSTEHGHG